MDVMEERFSMALHSTARSWRQVLDRRMRDLGISQACWTAIAVVARAKQPLSQIELANRLGIEGASMVATLDRLVKAGLIKREQSDTDRRIKLVMLTDAGEVLYRQVRNKAKTFCYELLREIDPEHLRVATELLEQLEGALETEA